MRINSVLIQGALILSVVSVLASPLPTHAQSAGGYKVTKLVSDQAQTAVRRDRNLVNPWGLAASPTGPWWVANEETGLMTLYDKNGKPIRSDGTRTVISVPAAGNLRGPGKPSGLIFNGTDDFVVTSNGKSGPALFVAVGTDGVISGWNPMVNAQTAVVLTDNSPTGAAYTGIALATRGVENVLAVANFGKGVVDIFDTKMNLIVSASDPNADEGFSPFNVANIDGLLYVTFAKRDDEGEDVPGPGLGLVDVFDTNGTLVRRFAQRGTLNAPWAVVLAPSDFGVFSNKLLIGNFGDGRINVFDPGTGDMIGQMPTRRGEPIEIEGLWSLSFGNGSAAGRSNVLYFTAGIDDETHGLFGKIAARPSDFN